MRVKKHVHKDTVAAKNAFRKLYDQFTKANAYIQYLEAKIKEYESERSISPYD